MRDPVLNEALKRLAAEASTRFSSLVATGDEIPFDVAEDSGESSLFYRYVPLTSRFVAAHAGELRSLPSYGPARGAVVTSGVAAPYLEARGLAVPSEPNQRAEEMLELFIGGLWEGSTGFSLDIARLDAALDAIEVESRDVHEADVLLAPLFGFEMTSTQFEFSDGTRIVRADTVDAPLEATSSEGTDRVAWQSAYLAIAPQDGSSDGPRRAVARLHELVRAMRLFKRGSVGLGPYAFAPVGEDAWKRLATGASSPRPGGYFLTETEAESLDSFRADMAAADGRGDRLAWAAQRFEYGCERPRALDALSDHLLAIRSVLSGDALLGAPLEARAAALVTGDGEDLRARSRMEHAFEMERAIIAGRDPMVGGEAPGELATWVEDGTRTILRKTILGEFGEDAGVAAEETLLTSGLQVGEGSADAMGTTAEWDAVPEPGLVPEPGERAYEPEIRLSREAEPSGASEEPRVEHIFDSEPEARALFAPDPEFVRDSDPIAFEDIDVTLETFSEHRTGTAEELDTGTTRMLEPVPEPEEITVTANTDVNADWLGTTGTGATLEWPAHTHEPHERVDTPRVRHLFPVPENTGTEWSVGELRYDRSRRSDPRR